MTGAIFISGEVFTISVEGLLRSTDSPATGVVAAGMFSLSSTENESFFTGESLIFRFSRVLAACEDSSVSNATYSFSIPSWTA